MKHLNIYRVALTIAGFLFLFLSILHCFQQLYFPLIHSSGGYTQDSVFLFNGSVALGLLFMSLIALSMARHKDSSLAQLKLVSVILILTWCGRLLLEIGYPATFRFLMIEQPTNVIKAGVVFLLCLLLTPFVLERWKKN